MKLIRVFYMVYSLTSGGIERYSINLYKNLDKKIIDMDFITKLDRVEFFDETLYSLGGKKIAVSAGCKGTGGWYKWNVLRKAFKVAGEGYDIAYFNLSSPADVFKYPMICRLRGIKSIVVHSHNSSEESIGVFKNILNRLGREYINHIATEKFACSDKAAAWMFGEKCVQQKDYVYIKNGLEIDQYTFNQSIRTKVRRSLGISEDMLLVGHVGRFVLQKNHIFLLEAFKDVLAERENVVLILVGVGELKSQIEEIVEKNGLSRNVKFLGERSDVNELFQAMDIFVLPSLYEGLPFVGVEAQASGLKCLFADTITREADITGNVEFLPLEKDEWKNKIVNHQYYERKNVAKDIECAGYNIKATAEIVQKIFNRIGEKER